MRRRVPLLPLVAQNGRPRHYVSGHIRTRLTEKFVHDAPDILRSI
jgi:hypothetical protein